MEKEDASGLADSGVFWAVILAVPLFSLMAAYPLAWVVAGLDVLPLWSKVAAAVVMVLFGLFSMFRENFLSFVEFLGMLIGGAMLVGFFRAELGLYAADVAQVGAMTALLYPLCKVVVTRRRQDR